MKKLILLSAVTAILAFVAGNALARDPILTISGSALIQKTNYVSSKSVFTGTTTTYSFNNKQLYNLISNIVANAGSWSYDDITPANLPADGYIAFSPNTYVPFTNSFNGTNFISSGGSYGLFYVTNKTGIYYPLSGTDGDGFYYSWVELDTQNTLYNTFTNITSTTNTIFSSSIQFGWLNTNIVAGLSIPNAPFNGVATCNVSDVTGAGTATETSTGLLYIHDDPYIYDDADNPDIFWDNFLRITPDGPDQQGANSNAIEIRGVVTATITYKNHQVSAESLSMTGSGNFEYQGQYGGVVKTASVTLK